MKKTINHIKEFYHWLLQPLLVLIILLVGYFGAKGLTLFKEEPPKTESIKYAPLVNTLQSRIENRTLVIRGNGSIEARTRINIVPQVGGRIIRIHPQLRAGGYFQANDILLEIEKIDYELTVISAESEVASAKRTLQLEAAEADAAIEEWEALHNDQPVPILVSRVPQIAEAKASLKAAKARLQQAQLNLKRTRIRMPFAGRIVQASMDVGEVVNANQSVGMVYSRELFEIPVPMEIDQLAWLDLDLANQSSDGIKGNNNHSENSADILITLAGKVYTLKGKLTRVESELDTVSRLARVIVTLKASDIPKQLREEVIPGLFVNVEIKARLLENITVLPRLVLHEGGVVWVVKNSQLEFFKPDIIHQSESEIWIQTMPADTLIITSALEVVTEGMQVRTMERE